MLSDEQREARKLGIGGSEIAAVVGKHPFLTPFDLIRSKKEPGYRVSPTPVMEYGTYMEPGVKQWYAARTSASLREVGTVVHPRYSMVRCTPDALATPVHGVELDLSVKNPQPISHHLWGEPGTDDIPDYCLLQVQWELLTLKELYGIVHAEVVAPIHGDLRRYPVRASEPIQEYLLDRAERFWRDCIVGDAMPDIDASEACKEYLKSRYPRDAASAMVQASLEQEALVASLFEWMDIERKANMQKKRYQNLLREEIGMAPGIEGDGFRISYRTVSLPSYINWEMVLQDICLRFKVPITEAKKSIDTFTEERRTRRFGPARRIK